MEFFELQNSKVYLLPVIRGLVSESDRVRKTLSEMPAQAIALSIGAEELKGLQEFRGSDAALSNVEEEAYVEGLRKFGEVKKPPPCFIAATEEAKKRGLYLLPLDMDDDRYTETFVNNVSTIDLILQSRLGRKLKRRRFEANTPEEFVLQFDRAVTSIGGYRRVEEAREAFMASRLRELGGTYSAIVALIERERAEGVKSHLRP